MEPDFECADCGWLWPYGDEPVPSAVCENCGGEMEEIL